VSLRAIHDFELALLDPCIAMLTRGVMIDEPKRQQMLADLRDMREPLLSQARQQVMPRLRAEPKLPSRSLFYQRKTCKCCRGGDMKMRYCWKCAGFDSAPTLRDLAERYGSVVKELKKNEAVAYFLKPCQVCEGEGYFDLWTFNPESEQQLKVVLYGVLKLPKRMKKGKLTTDEEALKSLLPHDQSGLVQCLLTLAKTGTMRSVLERIKPGEDGRIRSSFNPAGTETGRFSSSETFLVASTNLQNMPKREAAADPRFDVRQCFIPKPGHVLVEADLSGAEAWVTAACAGDLDLLERLRSGEDIHCWTAGYIFDKPADDVTPAERQLGKMARHALNYGMQWKTFQANVNAEADTTGVAIEAALAKRICASYHRLHPRLETWWRDVQRRLVASGTLRTQFGRERTFFGRGAGTWLSETHREAIAFEPQSSVADLLNRGLLRWWRQHDGKLGELILQVHDSVVVETPEVKAPLVVKLLRRCLTEEITVHGVAITIPTEVSTGTNWGAMETVV